MALKQMYTRESPGSHQPRAAFHLHWSDTGDSALPLQGAAIALLQQWGL